MTPSTGTHGAGRAASGPLRPDPVAILLALASVVLASLVLASLVLLATPTPARAAPDDDPQVVVHAGANRYATAAAVADLVEPGVAQVFLATGRDFPDAVAAVPVAAALGAPVLLVEPDAIPAATAQALERLEPGQITILGGESAVSPAVRAAAHAFTDGAVRRLAGPNRYATAAELAMTHGRAGLPVVYVASGDAWPDAVTGGPAAAVEGGVLLLVGRDRVPAATREAMEFLAPGRVVVLGGEAVVGSSVVDELEDLAGVPVSRRSGADRHATAAAVARASFPGVRPAAWLATGAAFPDGLTGGVVAGMRGEPLVTVRRDCIADDVLVELDRMVPDRLDVLGGSAVVGDGAVGLQACPDRDPLRTETIRQGLDTPWDVVFAPGDPERVFLTERDPGRVLELLPDGTNVEVRRFPHVDADHEGGLTGLAVSPEWTPGEPDTQWLYASYVYEDDDGTVRDQRVVRFRPGEADLQAHETVVTGLPHDGGVSHFAGRIEFGPDGMLWVSIGDVRDDAAAQDSHSLKGKILRYHPDGSVPDDNPFPVDDDDPDGPKEPVWALGFRDPQGMAWDADGRMYASEFGPDRDDEVNRITRGSNHGWPCVTGAGNPRQTSVCDGDDDLVDPIVVRDNLVASWSGIGVLDGSAFPEWDGDLFVAALRGQRLYRVDLDGGEVRGVEELLAPLPGTTRGQYGRLRHVTQAPDGSLWVLTSNQDDNGDPAPGDDRIVRIIPS